MAVAQQALSLQITPSELEVIIKPGKTVVLTYNIKNLGDPTQATVKILPFEAGNEKGDIRIKPEFEGPIRFQLDNSDIALDQPFFLKSNEDRQLILNLRIPENAPEGDYYYTVLIETEPQSSLLSNIGSQNKLTVGSLLLTTVTQTGVIDVKAKVTIFDVISSLSFQFGQQKIHLFDSSDRIPVSLIVSNKGINAVAPEGTINLRGNFGEQAKFTILPQNVLAQSQRLLSASPSAELACGDKPDSLCKSPISLIIPGFFIGNYKLSTTIDFGEGTPTISADTSFIALPFKFILAIIAVIGISYIIIRKIASQKTEEE